MPNAKRTLAIETATEACSIALFDESGLVAYDHRVLGRGHAEQLVPMIAQLPGRGRAQRIIVSLGPGSFTGVRIGIATARALGIAWGAKVMGYHTLALIAAMGLTQQADKPVTVCMNGGHGEWFVQNFSSSAVAEDTVQSLTPADAALACRHGIVAGNRATELVKLLGGKARAIELLPDARQTLRLGDQHLHTGLAPIYGRGPDAKLPNEAPAI